MSKRPISAYGLNRAVTNFARNGARTLNPRFLVIFSTQLIQFLLYFLKIKKILKTQGENILFLELDMPNRTTRDYEGPNLAPHLQAALDTALKDEEEIVVDEV